MKAPVGYTCPDINQCITWLNTAKENILRATTELENLDERPYEALSALDEAYKYCDVEKELEELRSANSALRDWGYELYEELEQLKREL